MSTPANTERLLTREELADWKGDLVICKFLPDGKEARALATIERMAAALSRCSKEFSYLPELGRDCIGNTNVSALNQWLEQARALLREYKGGSDVG